MKLKNIVLFLSMLLAFSACSDDTDPQLDIPAKVKLSEIGFGYIILDEENADKNVLTLKWAESKPELNVISDYIIQVDSAGNNFKTAKILTETKELSYTIAGRTLNDFLVKSFAQDPLTAARYEFRVACRITGKDVRMVLPETASPSQVLRITSMKSTLAKPILYIVGDALVGWGNEAGKIGADLQVFFADDSSAKNEKYTYTGFFKGGAGIEGLKFPTIAGDWNTTYGYKDGALGMNQPNFPAPAEDGVYTLTVDTKALTAKLEKYTNSVTEQVSVGIIGDAANGWGDGDDIIMTKVSKFVWVAKDVQLKKDKGMKFRADKKWDTQWGGNADAGKQQFPFDSNGGENINILADGSYFVAVNTLTGHHVIIPMADLPKK